MQLFNNVIQGMWKFPIKKHYLLSDIQTFEEFRTATGEVIG